MGIDDDNGAGTPAGQRDFPIMTVRLPSGDEREVQMMVTSDRHPDDAPMEYVERMFDASGAETFDPTEAVEIDAGGALRKLSSGDRLTIIVQI